MDPSMETWRKVNDVLKASPSLALEIVLCFVAWFLSPSKLVEVLSFFCCFPLMLYGYNLGSDRNLNALGYHALKSMLYCWLMMDFSLLSLIESGILDGESVFEWLKIAHSAGLTFLLPAFIILLSPSLPITEDETDKEDVVRVLVQPCKFALQFLPENLANTVVSSKKWREVARAYCSFLFLVCCTIVGAAAAAWLELIAVATTQSLLSIVSLLSLSTCLLFLFLSLNRDNQLEFSRLSSLRWMAFLSLLLIPTGISSALVADARGLCTLETIDEVTTSVRSAVWLSIFFAGSWMGRNREE